MRAHRTVEDEQKRFQWITTTVAAERIGVSPTHVVRLIADKELRARDVSRPGAERREWRVDPASVDRWLERRTTEAA